MNPRLADCLRLLRNRALWGMFPRDMRPFFLAQRGKCPYCGNMMVVESVGQATFMKKVDRRRQTEKRASWDHVFPRSRWGNHKWAKVLAHTACNRVKADRMPYACEVLFRDVTVAIVMEIEAAMTKNSANGTRRHSPDRTTARTR